MDYAGFSPTFRYCSLSVRYVCRLQSRFPLVIQYRPMLYMMVIYKND
jgi:hypothetical protein